MNTNNMPMNTNSFNNTPWSNGNSFGPMKADTNFNPFNGGNNSQPFNMGTGASPFGFDTGSNSFGPMKNGPWNYGYNQVIPATAESDTPPAAETTK